MLDGSPTLAFNGRSTELVQKVLSETQSQSAAIFLCNRAGSCPWVRYLHVQGLTDMVSADYAEHGLFRHDPFLDPGVLSGRGHSRQMFLLEAEDRDIQSAGAAEPYWRFIRRHNLSVVGASIRPIREDLFLAIGLHGHSRRRSVSVTAAAQEMEWLTDIFLSGLLEDILSRTDPRYLLDLALPEEASGAPKGLDVLSTKETEIAQMVVNGYRNKQIAYQIGASDDTVENNLRRIYKKLGVSNRAGLAAAFTTMRGLGRVSH